MDFLDNLLIPSDGLRRGYDFLRLFDLPMTLDMTMMFHCRPVDKVMVGDTAYLICIIFAL